MFENFTERLRAVLTLARQEAQKANSEYIGTEHMLMGVVKNVGGIGFKVLQKLNVREKELGEEIHVILRELHKKFPPSDTPVDRDKIMFSPRAKGVLDIAREASASLGSPVIGTEHLLIALSKESEGIAAQALLRLGVTPDMVRDFVLEALGRDVQAEVPIQYYHSQSEKINDVLLLKKHFFKRGDLVKYRNEPYYVWEVEVSGDYCLLGKDDQGADILIRNVSYPNVSGLWED